MGGETHTLPTLFESPRQETTISGKSGHQAGLDDSPVLREQLHP